MADQPNYYQLADTAATDNGLDPFLVRGVMDTESGGTNRATATSSKGARGPMQLMPGTAADMGVDPTDPAANVKGGAAYLSKLKGEFGSDRLALMAYNWGPGNVRKWQDSGAKPQDIPAETRAYLDRVQTYRARHAAAAAAQGSDQPATQAQGDASAPQKTAYSFKVDGVPFTVKFAGTRDQAAAELQKAIDQNPGLLASKAAANGMHYDWATGRAREYGTVEKIMIGAGKEFHDAFTGTEQLIAHIDNNAEAVQYLKDQTDQERQLYDHLNKPGQLDPTDVGEALAFAPLLFGPTGIVGMAGRMFVARGVQSTGNQDTHLGNAVGGAAEGALAGLGALGTSVGYSLVKAIGASSLGKAAATALLDLHATGGGVTAARLGKYALNTAKKLAESDTKVAGRGPNAWDRSGSAGPDVGADTQANPVAMASRYLSDVGHAMKNDVNQRLLDIAASIDNPSQKELFTRLLGMRLATAFGAADDAEGQK